MLGKWNPVGMWKKLSRKEKKMFAVGIIFGLVLTTPLIFMRTVYSPPAGYDMTIVENKILYNQLYDTFYGEIGNATDGDIAIIITFNLTDSVYRNIAIIPTGSDEIYIYAFCFYDVENEVFEVIDNPLMDEVYIVDVVENTKGLIIFLYAGELILNLEIWMW